MPNTIGSEAIAVHTLGNLILWSFSVLVIPKTPGSYQFGNMPGSDGQSMGTGTDQVWLFTPKQAFDGASYPTQPTANPASNTPHANVDLGGNAIRETANFSFGVATAIGATIILCRAASNTVINHPRTGKSSYGTAMTESVLLCFAWTATLTGMAAAGLGFEPKTGWAVFAVMIVCLLALSCAYSSQIKEDEAEAKRTLESVGVPGGSAH